ncbi:hypothetical protein KP509_31G059800 [Ceratopteris richardii]|uniref:GDSL esterase/lipase n=3 Tax=Ceratopteris richardii TaxID=49495 RepID=A0A8T2QZ78_CERRI|nr:hypothetical protein KP509_31G059800 [Ceratopteris richardii]
MNSLNCCCSLLKAVGAVALMVTVLLASTGVESRALLGRREALEGGSKCEAPLVIFGASMIDVGENANAQPLTVQSEFVPYGVDYFGKPVARFSNGRVIADFLSQKLGYGLLDAYLNSVNPRFTYGVDFASSGSTAVSGSQTGSAARGSGLFPLDTQVKQYKLFKSKIMDLEAENKDLTLLRLPSILKLTRGIHVMMPAHNDYSNVLVSSANLDAPTLVSAVVSAIELALRGIHGEGARTMILMNVLPLGCAPSFLGFALTNPSLQKDKDSCIASYNAVVDLHNAELKKMVESLRTELSWTGLVLFDLNAIYLDAVRNPSKYAVTKPLAACCGAGANEYNINLAIPCGKSGTVNGTTVTAGRCSDPSQYISWDGLHPTESFAEYIASAMLKGEFTYPSFSLDEACKP